MISFLFVLVFCCEITRTNAFVPSTCTTTTPFTGGTEKSSVNHHIHSQRKRSFSSYGLNVWRSNSSPYSCDHTDNHEEEDGDNDDNGAEYSNNSNVGGTKYTNEKQVNRIWKTARQRIWKPTLFGAIAFFGTTNCNHNGRFALPSLRPPAAHASAPVMALPKAEGRDPASEAIMEHERRMVQKAQADLRERDRQAREIERTHVRRIERFGLLPKRSTEILGN